MPVDYTKLLGRFFPDKLQTNCKALARHRYKRHNSKHTLGYKIIEKYQLRINDGKAFVYWEAKFRRF